MTDCIFCAITAGQAPASVLHADASCLVLMDIMPLRPGHVLVINRRHAQYVHELTPAERAHLFEVGSRVGQALRASALKPADLHFMINDGPVAHQTVPHVHLHVLPRYRGDSLGFVRSLLAKPMLMLTGGANRARLERQAALIRTALAGLTPGSAETQRQAQ